MKVLNKGVGSGYSRLNGNQTPAIGPARRRYPAPISARGSNHLGRNGLHNLILALRVTTRLDNTRPCCWIAGAFMCRFELLSVFFGLCRETRVPPEAAYNASYHTRSTTTATTTATIASDMLHEILLSLSGHPSALFDAQKDPSHVTTTPLSLLSPPEAELLSSLGHLSRLHRETRHHVAKLASNHPSTVCRAVATAIASKHLGDFQQKILLVESRILKQDPSTVGAYNIVPLAGVVGNFSEWTRLMEWLWDISNFAAEPGSFDTESGMTTKCASGAAIIDKLRNEAQTGYPDIESAASYLGIVAETSWLRQLSTWLIYGRLPSFGASDFFIKSEEDEDEDEDASFMIENKLLPKFVTQQTAASILFVGRSLNQIRSLPSSSRALASASSRSAESQLLPEHVAYLSKAIAPISTAKLSEAVKSIRLSLSRNLLQHLLPREKIVEVLTVLHQFFLLGRGEFAVALIAEADEKLHSRHRALVSNKSGHGIQGILLKETEISNALSRSWSTLSSLSGEDDHTDDTLDLAIDTVHLSVHTAFSHRPGTPGRARESSVALPIIADVVFSDLLLSIPTQLTMDIRSPLDLFITKSDMDVYSNINAYLLSIRRAHLHLGQLWRQSSIRREHPPPPGYQYSNSVQGRAILHRRRQRGNIRAQEMRKVWATCAAAVFFLAESEAYFQGEVVQQSFKHFLHWVEDPTDRVTDDLAASSGSESTGKSIITERRQHDPEALSSAHRQFLGSVAYALLLTDHTFTKLLRDFFTHADQLVAFITRLQTIRQNLDLEEDNGIEDYSTNYRQEEKDIALELDRSRRRLDSDMKGLMSRLRDIDAERVGSSPNFGRTAGTWEEAEYESLRIGGIDRLLMKLDWGGSEEVEAESHDLV